MIHYYSSSVSERSTPRRSFSTRHHFLACCLARDTSAVATLAVEVEVKAIARCVKGSAARVFVGVNARTHDGVPIASAIGAAPDLRRWLRVPNRVLLEQNTINRLTIRRRAESATSKIVPGAEIRAAAILTTINHCFMVTTAWQEQFRHVARELIVAGVGDDQSFASEGSNGGENGWEKGVHSFIYLFVFFSRNVGRGLNSVEIALFKIFLSVFFVTRAQETSQLGGQKYEILRDIVSCDGNNSRPCEMNMASF